MSATMISKLEARDWEGARQLLSELEILDERNAEGATAAQVAAYSMQPDLAKELAAKMADVDFATACTVGDLSAAERHLAAQPTAVNQLSRDGFTPASLAAAFSQNEVLQLLLKTGADPNLRGNALGGVAPIHAAVFGWNLRGVELLLENGAQVDLRQAGGFTALHAAAQNNNKVMVEALLAAGANQSLANDEGKTARDFATDATMLELL